MVVVAVGVVVVGDGVGCVQPKPVGEQPRTEYKCWTAIFMPLSQDPAQWKNIHSERTPKSVLL